MKTFNFSGSGEQTLYIHYEIKMTSEELAEHLTAPGRKPLSVAEIEAMGEDEVKALIEENRRLLEYLIDEEKVEVDCSGSEVYVGNIDLRIVEEDEEDEGEESIRKYRNLRDPSESGEAWMAEKEAFFASLEAGDW